MLLSFAQFEREMISERTRDKMRAARRKGKWTGGFPMLGYDLDPVARKLTVNEPEAERVRGIFQIFLETKSLSQTLEELERRRWKTKGWTTKKSKARRSVPFDRPALVRVLENPIYLGEVRHGGRRYPGEQPAIVDQRVWERTNRLLDQRKRGESSSRERRPALLEGRLLCRICGRAMAHGYTSNQGRRHRYYRCQKARKTGANACPGQTVAAERIEYAVLAKLAESTGELVPDLDKLVESIRYDHRAELATVKLKSEDSELSIIIRKDRSGRRYRLHNGRLRFPRIAEIMALAIRFDQLFRDGVARNGRELAARVGISPTRVAQIMKFANLAPAIQERLLFTEPDAPFVSEAALRRVAAERDWERQLPLYEGLVREAALGSPAAPEPGSFVTPN